MPKVLILYLFENTGHHCAAKAIDAALQKAEPTVKTLCVDPLSFTHPKISAFIRKTYMGIIRHTPEVWDALYFNKRFDALTRQVAHLVQRGKSKPFLNLINSFEPDAIICTQAYPFGLMQAYSRHYENNLKLWCILTDYRPHRFWTGSSNAEYIVPTQSAGNALTEMGINPDKIKVFGIPIDPRFQAMTRNIQPDARHEILFMGGNQGLGISPKAIKELDKSQKDFIVHVVTGKNRRLRRRLLAQRSTFSHHLTIKGTTREACKLMSRASILISKPGGLTCAESTALGLPIIIIHALPGQENGNAEELVAQGAAIRIKHIRQLAPTIDSILDDPEYLAKLGENARAIGKPDAALKTANYVLKSL